jgi:gliding motility-associated-like protein
MGLCFPFDPLPDAITSCSSEVILDAGPNFIDYLWSTNEKTQAIRATKNGQYTVRASKGYDCDVFDTTVVTLLNAKIMQADTTICRGRTVRLTIDTSSFAAFRNTSQRPTILWSTGETTSSISVSPTSSTKVIATIQFGSIICRDSVQIGIMDATLYNPFRDTIFACTGLKVRLDAGNQYSHYKWNTGNITPNIEVTQTGKYQLTVGSSLGCIGRDSVYVRCLGQSYQVSIDPLLGGTVPIFSKILWSNGATTATTTLKPLLTSRHFVTVLTDTLQCRDSINIVVIDPAVVNAIIPSVTISADKLEVCTDKSVSFSSNVANAGSSPAYTWRVNGVSVGASKTLALNSVNQNTSVKLEVTSNITCAVPKQVVSNTIDIKVIECDFSVFIPNSFSPNGDGKNDIFKVYGDYFYTELTVYNQWGELIFRGNGRQGWDGYHKGILQPSGIYVYVAEIQETNDQKRVKRGNINLIR